MFQGVRLLGRPFCEQVDNPRANMEICVISEAGTKFLNEEELDRVVTSIEKDIEKDQAQ